MVYDEDPRPPAHYPVRSPRDRPGREIDGPMVRPPTDSSYRYIRDLAVRFAALSAERIYVRIRTDKNRHDITRANVNYVVAELRGRPVVPGPRPPQQPQPPRAARRRPSGGGTPR